MVEAPVDGLGARVALRIESEQPTSGPDRLRLRLAGSALAAQLRPLRHRLAAWAAGTGLPEQDVDDLVLATYEALVNVVDHAFGNGDGEAVLDAGCDGSGVEVVVRDNGHWRPPPVDPGLRGRGLTLITSLAQDVAVNRGAGGTTVCMRWSLEPDHTDDRDRRTGTDNGR